LLRRSGVRASAHHRGIEFLMKNKAAEQSRGVLNDL
jgi:hypothetical protein